jgi:hypothetical protein
MIRIRPKSRMEEGGRLRSRKWTKEQDERRENSRSRD